MTCARTTAHDHYGTVPMEIGLIHKSQNEWKPLHVPRASTLLLGKSKTGKTTALVRLALNDIHAGHPVVFIDPVGDSVTEILNHIPHFRQSDVQLVEPHRYPFALNLLSTPHPLLASTILEIIKSGSSFDIATPRIDNFIIAGVKTLEYVPGATLVHLKLLYTNKKIRASFLAHVSDSVLLDFWHDFEKMSDREQRDRTESTLSRLNPFLYEPSVRNCVIQKKNRLSFSGIVLVLLSRTHLGQENVSLLGSIILGALNLYGGTTTVYVDDAHLMGGIYGTVLTRFPTIATVQSLSQLRREVLRGVTVVPFRTTYEDAETLLFPLTNDQHQLYDLPDHYAYLGHWDRSELILMPQHHFSPTHEADKIRARSQTQYSAPPSVIADRTARIFRA